MIETTPVQSAPIFRRLRVFFRTPERSTAVCYCVVSLVLLAIYAPMVSLPFVGGDDFREIARAEFEDSKNPDRILTTPHDGNRYRPLDRAVTLITYKLGGFNPSVFRYRNIVFHILNAILVGYLIAALIDNKKIGPAASLLFGLHPANALPVGLAVTTKTLFGLVFSIVCVLWVKIARKKQTSAFEMIALYVSSLLAVLLHEQGSGVVLLPILVCGVLALRERKQAPYWCTLGTTMAVSIALVVVIGRSHAGIAGSVPAINPARVLLRNSGLAIVGLFAPIDFLIVFGRFAVTRGNIAFLSRPTDYILQISLYLAGILAVLGFLALGLVSSIRSQKSAAQFVVMLFGLAIALSPVIFFSVYSELYSYVPSVFALGLLVGAVRSMSSFENDRRLKIAGLTFVVFLTCSYAASTIYRNRILWDVARQTQTIVTSVPRLVPEPDPGARFVLLNQPGRDDGYSLYGLQGVGAFEEFGAQPAVQMIYRRDDLSAVLLSSEDSIADECMAHKDRTIYILYWNDDVKQLFEGSCDAE